MAKRQRIEIKEAWDLEDIMSDMFHEFLESLIKKKGMRRKPNPNIDGSFAYEVGFIYTEKAMCLIRRYKKRMEVLFLKYYPDSYLSLTTSLYLEP